MSGTNDVPGIIGDIPFVDFDNSSTVRFWGETMRKRRKKERKCDMFDAGGAEPRATFIVARIFPD